MEPAKFYRPSKRLGQNFLRDLGTASQIVTLAQLTTKDTVLEPGAGYGTLTERLQGAAGRVIAVEKDRYLAPYLRERFRDSPSVQVIEGDVLKVPLPSFNKIVGTPPYNISSKLILFLLASRFDTAHLVLQKEFGERLLARPGTAEYGRLSVTAQRRLEIRSLLEIPRTTFNPRPRVDSVLLAFSPKTARTDVDQATFDDMLRGIFSQRRRLLKGVMSHYLERRLGKDRAKAVIEELTLPSARVYQLSVAQLEDLCVQLSNAQSQSKPGIRAHS